MRISCLYSLGIWLACVCVKLNMTILTLHIVAMLLVGTKNKIREGYSHATELHEYNQPL